ncbi:MAG: hypothetical protein ACYDD4_00875 [Acidimicrobiales bacterium]
MTPGERCDEIMRLIDETLDDYAAATGTECADITPGASAPSRVRAQTAGLPRSA